MFYVLVRESKRMIAVYPEPTQERANNLAHCMGGFWRYKDVVVVEAQPQENGQPPWEVWEKHYPKYKPNYDLVTIYNQGYNRDNAQNFYCIPKALNWRPGMPKCL